MSILFPGGIDRQLVLSLVLKPLCNIPFYADKLALQLSKELEVVLQASLPLNPLIHDQVLQEFEISLSLIRTVTASGISNHR